MTRLLRRGASGLLALAIAWSMSACREAVANAAAPPQKAETDADHTAGDHTSGGGHGNGEAHGNIDPLSFDPDLAICTMIVFLLLLAVLWKFAWGPIVVALDKRERSVAEHIAAAERANEEARQMLANYEKKLAGAAGQVTEILAEARRDADHTRQEILAEAKTAADAERVRALRDIESATDQALKQLAEKSASLAVELAGKIMRSKLSADEHSRLVQEALARFPEQAASKN